MARLTIVLIDSFHGDPHAHHAAAAALLQTLQRTRRHFGQSAPQPHRSSEVVQHAPNPRFSCQPTSTHTTPRTVSAIHQSVSITPNPRFSCQPTCTQTTPRTVSALHQSVSIYTKSTVFLSANMHAYDTQDHSCP